VAGYFFKSLRSIATVCVRYAKIRKIRTRITSRMNNKTTEFHAVCTKMRKRRSGTSEAAVSSFEVYHITWNESIWQAVIFLSRLTIEAEDISGISSFAIWINHHWYVSLLGRWKTRVFPILLFNRPILRCRFQQDIPYIHTRYFRRM